MEDAVRNGPARRRKAPWYPLMLVPAGIALNMLVSKTAAALGLPLYLDTLGTVLAAVLGGYLPGILTGYLTNLLNGFSDVTNIYYGSINALIGVAAAFYASRGYWDKKFRALLTVPVFTLIGGALGSLLTWYLYSFSINLASPSGGLSLRLYGIGVPIFWSQFIADIIMDLPDKTLIVLMSLGILRLIPQKWRPLFRFEGWWQAPLPSELKEAASHPRFRSLSMRTKLLLLIAVAIVSITLGFTVVFDALYHNTIIDENETLATGVAKLAATAFDPDRVDEYMELGEKAEGYLEAEAKLQNIRSCSPDLEYIYIYKILPDGCHVVFDLDTEGVPGSEPGTIIPFDESFEDYIPDLLAGKRIEPLITDDTYGWLMTVYEPVFDSTGQCVCYACTDISMNRLSTNEASFMARVIALSLGVFLLILFIGLWIAEYNIILPINTMTLTAGAFAYDSEAARADSVQRFRELDIGTGDEIESLYGAVGKTMDDTVRYVEDLQTQTETINRMQNGLIWVLADMVESRDQCTGDHVRKTAAYARIIMEHMNRLGIYTDQLSEKFCNDVVNSAPLHDVGKIHVSDTLLNKPGRLTDEEYAQMKTHTTAGREIIEKAIQVVGGGDTGYLQEARNLSAYHHERWDGKGYPSGLAGEDIPLSARIMAVADVFDALVSRRSYKVPFSFEKAMDIIKEGAGTQFDPSIVQAFVDASDEVRKVAESFTDTAVNEKA